jgi:hypothetical protein
MCDNDDAIFDDDVILATKVVICSEGARSDPTTNKMPPFVGGSVAVDIMMLL